MLEPVLVCAMTQSAAANDHCRKPRDELIQSPWIAVDRCARAFKRGLSVDVANHEVGLGRYCERLSRVQWL